MSDSTRVSVCSWGPGRCLTLTWTDPISGKRKTRSAKTLDWRIAERLGGELEKELESGCTSPSRITFDEFLARYSEEKLDTLAQASKQSSLSSLRHLKRVLGVQYLGKLTPAGISQFATKLRQAGMRDTTIAHHLRHVKAALRWAGRQGLLVKVPAIEMPKRAKGQTLARSRAITTEEYERMAAAIPRVRPKDSGQWARFIEGLWLSGLRRSEALALTWDQDGAFCVCLAEKRPVFIIRAEGQKSGKAETCPIAPDFGAWLLAVPPEERQGPVFRLPSLQAGLPITPNRVGKIVERISKKAGVKVGTRTKRDRKTGKTTEVPMFAGCHSLRRGFGSKWARKVPTAILKRMMRHSSIATTEGYYVHLNAADVSDELWEKYGPGDGNDSGQLQQSSNTPPAKSTAP